MSRFEEAKENLDQGVSDLVDILATEGADIANASYGSMAVAWPHKDSEGDFSATGHIGVSAETPDVALIAEFGAGDDTTAVKFENPPDEPVYPGAYSESPKGAGQYATMGRWFYGGREYRYVEPRMGLYNAKTYIVANGHDIAEEVVQL